MKCTTLFAKVFRLVASAAISPKSGCVAVSLSENVLAHISKAPPICQIYIPATDANKDLDLLLDSLHIRSVLEQTGRRCFVHGNDLVRIRLNIGKSEVDTRQASVSGVLSLSYDGNRYWVRASNGKSVGDTLWQSLRADQDS